MRHWSLKDLNHDISFNWTMEGNLPLKNKDLITDFPILDKERVDQLEALQKKLKCRFKNLHLLNTTLTHKSFANESKDRNVLIDDNERLEFLGDAILSYIITDSLLERFPNHTEGMLSKLRAHLVSENVLSSIAMKYRLGEYLLLGKGEENTGGRFKKSILANCFEALLAGIYMDQGLEITRNFITKSFQPFIDELSQNNFVPDFKTILQEYAQGALNCTPSYQVTSQNGLDHEKVFEVTLIINKKTYGMGEGRSKKEAEQKAACEALRNMKIDGLKF
ncbi:MAG: ribonuclease III [bacterium]